MKPAGFEYFAPPSVAEAVGLLAAHGPEAKVLAGGQSLVPLMSIRLARPSVIVDIRDRVIAQARIALTGVGPTPVRALREALTRVREAA